jgi:hypothetical protein
MLLGHLIKGQGTDNQPLWAGGAGSMDVVFLRMLVFGEMRCDGNGLPKVVSTLAQ